MTNRTEKQIAIAIAYLVRAKTIFEDLSESITDYNTAAKCEDAKDKINEVLDEIQ